jgi:general secretion pathway protein H
MIFLRDEKEALLKSYFKKSLLGFTLIELLVVVFIIGIVSAVIAFTGGSRHNFRETEAFAEELKSRILIIREQSTTQMTTLGLQVNDKNYEFLQFEKSTGKWISLQTTDSFWQAYKIPSDITLGVTVEPKNLSADLSKSDHPPQIIFLPNGDITAFTITISSKSNKRVLQITGNSDGTILLQEMT